MKQKGQKNAAIPVILDTDMGPDCDDAGALAVLLSLANQGEAEILGVMHCTSSPWGSGCISAINTYFGRADIPIGTLQDGCFLNDAVYQKYNIYLSEHYLHSLRQGRDAEDATTLYRRLLATAADRSVVIIAIGPLINLYHLMNSKSDDIYPWDGETLIKEKVDRLVVMGGVYPSGKEWNFEMHPIAAKFVVDHWPAPVTFCGYEVGIDVLTGSRLFSHTAADHPVRKAYELYLEKGQTRSSWDPITVLIGVRGECELWDVEHEGWVEVNEMGENKWNTGKISNKEHSYIKMKGAKAEIEAIIDELMSKEIDVKYIKG
ncbi:nucleoside hydrolase [Paenibacillus sp. GCM10027626]|uniref:nucleoside hydrolase n=1 Tax=Paenibacillus sp. GCM10027626 TaxID=3273411 RepID=UPI00362830A3